MVPVQGRDCVCDNSSIKKMLGSLEKPIPGLGLQITMILSDTTDFCEFLDSSFSLIGLLTMLKVFVR